MYETVERLCALSDDHLAHEVVCSNDVQNALLFLLDILELAGRIRDAL